MNVSRKSGSFGTNLGRRSNIEEPLSRPAPLRSARSESQLSDVTQGSDEMESPEKNDRFDMDAVKLKMKSHLVDNQNKTNSASFDEDILDGGDDEYEDDMSANSEMAHTPNISQSVEDMKKFSEDVKKFAERSVTQPSSYLKPASSLSNDYSLEGYESLYRDESDGVLKRPFLAMKETTAPDHKTIGSTTPSDRSYASENNKRADASSPYSYTSNSAKPVTKETTSTGMNSVEEIMQRWYNIDSDFLTVDTTEEFLDKNTKVDSKAEIASVQLVGTEKPPLVPIAAPFRSLAVVRYVSTNKIVLH